MADPADSQRVYSSLARTTLLLLLGSTWLAVDALGHARPRREVVIYGTVTAAQAPVAVDADLRCGKIRVKVRPNGQQFVAFPAEGDHDVWAPKQDGPASYGLTWQRPDRFELRLAVQAHTPPHACRLTFHLPEGGEQSTLPFPLRSEQGKLLGFAPTITLTPRAVPVVPPPSRPSVPFPRPEEEPLADPEDAAELRAEARAAVFEVNRIPILKLRALCAALDRQKDPETAKIGRMLNGVLQRKLQFLTVLDWRSGSFRQTPADVVDEGPILDPAEGENLSEN